VGGMDVVRRPRVRQIDVGRHRTFGAYALLADCKHLERVAYGIAGRGAPEPAKDHARPSTWRICRRRTGPGRWLPAIPGTSRHSIADAGAGLLPAEHGAQRHRPRRAFIRLVAAKTIEEQRQARGNSKSCAQESDMGERIGRILSVGTGALASKRDQTLSERLSRHD
jgi:hypothetical protein